MLHHNFTLLLAGSNPAVATLINRLILLYYFFRAIAIVTIPRIAIAVAGAIVSPLFPATYVHTAKTRQRNPTINLSLLKFTTLDLIYN